MIIQRWQPLQTVKEVQSFLGFANYYRRFIINFAEISKPLTALLHKDVIFEWTPEANTAFEKLKNAFSTPPILKFYDFTKSAVYYVWWLSVGRRVCLGRG